MPRGNPSKLIPTNQRSKQEVSEIGRLGGIASGEARREKAALREVAKKVLAAEIPTSGGMQKVKKLVEDLGFSGQDATIQSALVAGAALEGIKGNVNASKFLLEATGEKIGAEATGDESGYTGLPARILGSEWVDVNRSIDDREYAQYDFRGGRGSLKSSFCGLKLVDLIMLNSRFCGLAIKQLKTDLRDSIYAQTVWAIDELGLTDEFKCTISPMQITRISTGQIIYFRGGDEPNKIKSLKPPRDMYIGVIWIEEADQIRGTDALRSIKQSAFRGGDEGILFRSYNTPISQLHYINVESRKANPRRLIHHSHFKNAPRRWLGEAFWDEAEALKASNERAYRHEYDGEATGTGATVFENIVQRQITDKEIEEYDRIYYGIDWGYFPDPFHFSEMYYNAGNRKLYIFGERRLWKSSNQNSANEIEKYKDCKITADSAEPKSIDDFRDWGFDVRAAEKGPGSVEYSMKWLQGLSEIVIDPVRCPYTAEEFVIYEYPRNKDDEIMSEFSDKDNHSIDSVRYAMNEMWRKRGK